ncbi:MAG: M81 family metallopeptidase [Caulobacteraceae bacterium]|nr:M81 family metallopeptidase [Caulobacteraceae bacterium]
MRILTAGLMTETNTFSPLPTGWAAFEAFGVQRGRDGLTETSVTAPALLWESLARAEGHAVAHSVITFAQPAGPTVRAVYESLRDEILRDAAEQGPFDAVLLLLHGAMVADGYDDCEGDLLTRLREVVGPGVVIGAELDLHCHVSPAMAAGADVLVAFKEYPHTDSMERARELYRLVVDAAAGRIRPTLGLHDCGMVGLYFTQTPDMRAFVDGMVALERQPPVLSVSLAHGFPWGDVADNSAKVLVYTDGDAEAAARHARQLGAELWALRDKVAFKGLGVDEALDRVAIAPPGLVVLADTADNAGGGAPGDSTFMLARMLDRGVGNACLGPLWDPVAVGFCQEAGVGAELDLRVGGKACAASGPPLDLKVRVRALCAELRTPSYTAAMVSLGAASWIEIVGTDIHVVLCAQRMQGFSPKVFTELGLEVAAMRLAVVKSYNHFYAAFAPIAVDIAHVAGPGALMGDMAAIPFRRRDLDYWPRVAEPARAQVQPAFPNGNPVAKL